MSCFPCKPLLTHQTRRVNYAVAGFSFKKGLRREADFAFAPGSHQTMGPSINYVTMTNYNFNYDLILSVMGERSNSESRDSEDFRQKFDSKTSDYIEETLKPHFGELIQFITECETLIEKGQDSKLRSYQFCLLLHSHQSIRALQLGEI